MKQGKDIFSHPLFHGISGNLSEVSLREHASGCLHIMTQYIHTVVSTDMI